MSTKLNTKRKPKPKQRPVTTLKKILHAGKGLPIEFVPDTKAVFHYEVLIPPAPDLSKPADGDEPEQERGRLFPEDRSLYKSIDTTKKCWPDGYGKALELVFGKKFQLPFFEDCLKTMLIDEVSQFDVYDPSEVFTYPVLAKKLRDISRAEVDKNYDPKKDPDAHAHHCAASGPVKLGYPELDELLREPKPLRFVFHLLKVFKPEEYAAENWQMNETQKLASLDRLREEGNRLFSAGDFSAATEKYKEALGLIDQLMLREKPNDPEWLDLDRRNIPFYLNLSQCYLKLMNFYEAAECASEVLRRDPSNEKALFRRAKARIGTWDLDLAKEDLEFLDTISPTNQALVQENLAIIEEKRREKSRDDKMVYKAMFK